jgi:hypothetical protein
MTIYTAKMLIEIARKKFQQSQRQDCVVRTPVRDPACSQASAVKPDFAFAASR